MCIYICIHTHTHIFIQVPIRHAEEVMEVFDAISYSKAPNYKFICTYLALFGNMLKYMKLNKDMIYKLIMRGAASSG